MDHILGLPQFPLPADQIRVKGPADEEMPGI